MPDTHWLCREHLAAPNATTRRALLTMPLATRAGALAALSVIEADGEDHALIQHLIGSLRLYAL
jgi:hypothetical protein